MYCYSYSNLQSNMFFLYLSDEYASNLYGAGEPQMAVCNENNYENSCDNSCENRTKIAFLLLNQKTKPCGGREAKRNRYSRALRSVIIHQLALCIDRFYLLRKIFHLALCLFFTHFRFRAISSVSWRFNLRRGLSFTQNQPAFRAKSVVSWGFIPPLFCAKFRCQLALRLFFLSSLLREILWRFILPISFRFSVKIKRWSGISQPEFRITPAMLLGEKGEGEG